MHDCISKVRKEIMSESDSIKYVRFKLSGIRSFVNGKDVGENKTGQEIIVGHDKKKKDGTIQTKEEKTFITHTYCPFCGKKYK